jgi:hypothetical protein
VVGTENMPGTHTDFFFDASLIIKLSERKSDHSFLSVSEVKTECLLHALAARYLYITGTFICHETVSNKVTRIFRIYIKAILWVSYYILLVYFKNHSVLDMGVISVLRWTGCEEICWVFGCSFLIE